MTFAMNNIETKLLRRYRDTFDTVCENIPMLVDTILPQVLFQVKAY